MVEDPVGDVAEAHIDVVFFAGYIEDGELWVTFLLRDLPPMLTFNRPEVPEDHTEYSWSVFVDVDGDAGTGDSAGFDYVLMATDAVASGPPLEWPIPGAVKAHISRSIGDQSWARESDAGVSADPDADMIQIWSVIPGISDESKLFFSAYDYLAERMDLIG
jgi:hypothetical protein